MRVETQFTFRAAKFVAVLLFTASVFQRVPSAGVAHGTRIILVKRVARDAGGYRGQLRQHRHRVVVLSSLHGIHKVAVPPGQYRLSRGVFLRKPWVRRKRATSAERQVHLPTLASYESHLQYHKRLHKRLHPMDFFTPQIPYNKVYHYQKVSLLPS